MSRTEGEDSPRRSQSTQGNPREIAIDRQGQAVIREHIAGRIALEAPALLPYELSNAVWQAERRGRITRFQADEILLAMTGLDIAIIPQDWGVMLLFARQFNCSAYDAAYLLLAQQTRQPLLTGDLRLFNAVHT